MSTPRPTSSDVFLHRSDWRRFGRSVRAFVASTSVERPRVLIAFLIGLMLGINGLNVLSSYIGRDFMTAIARRAGDQYLSLAGLYVGVFLVSSIVAALFRFCEERLGLLWRTWLTRRMLGDYLSDRIYYRLAIDGKIGNPDQRLAEDIRTFATSTISVALMLLNSTLTVLAFAGVLWTISPKLLLASVLYAAVGSGIAVIMGRPLVALNYDQSDREANFRAELIHLRDNAESVALLHREGRIRSRLLLRLDELARNWRRIVASNRNVAVFTNAYNYLIQVIPIVIVAPLFLRDEIEFGVITQSAVAFAHLSGAFSLIVTQVQSLSTYAAVAARLGRLAEAVEAAGAAAATIQIVERAECLTYEGLTLRSPRDGRVLLDALNLTIPCGTNVLVVARDTTAKVAFFRATAGIWEIGEGRIIRPTAEQIVFLPERPYLLPGTLRSLLVRTGREKEMPTEELRRAMELVGVESVAVRVGGLDSEQDWHRILSLDEQQLLLFARLLVLKPRVAFLDRPGTALNPTQVSLVLSLLAQHGVSYVTVGADADRPDRYDAVLEFEAGGRWRWESTEGMGTPAVAV